MARRVLPVAIAVAVAFWTASIHARMSPEPRALESGEAFVPQPAVAQVAAMGFDAVLSDYYWLTAVQIVGDKEADPTDQAVQLGRLIDVATTLDPWVDHPYRFAAIWLTRDEAAVREGNRLLRRGIEHHPDEWRNHFYLGFNHFFYLGENVEAAQALESAAELPGSPRYLPRLVARLRSETADVEAAEVFLRQLVREAPDEHARAEYQAALDEIEIEYRARVLDRARDAFRELHGRDIEKVQDLLLGAHPVLASLPPAEPSSLPPSLHRGSRWVLDPDGGEIHSTYYGRRYRVNFHPQERDRVERRMRGGAADEEFPDAG